MAMVDLCASSGRRSTGRYAALPPAAWSDSDSEGLCERRALR
jgi:hypothetical protein